MELLYSLIIAVLVGSGFYLFFQTSLIRIIIGVLILSNAANLIIFAAGDIEGRKAPIIDMDQSTLSGAEADPLPQALILTAIVIGFAVIAFLLVLTREFYKDHKVHNLVGLKDEE